MKINNIKLYSWGTPNGRKVSILLEELNMRLFSCSNQYH